MKQLALAVLLLLGCNGNGITIPTGPVPMTKVFSDRHSGLRTPREEVIAQPARWQQVWDEIMSTRSPKPPLPAVDFDRDIVLLAALGETGDACKSLVIEEVTHASDLLFVKIKETRPPMSCSCPPVTVQPVDIVTVPRRTTTATFSRRSVTEGAACN
jgi:hypothetical protein